MFVEDCDFEVRILCCVCPWLIRRPFENVYPRMHFCTQLDLEIEFIAMCSLPSGFMIRNH